ncbi:peptidoglycan DD-metalloendopeptidase family protein [Psychroflexus sp. MES1-P1E]|uniref:peptidoglycan DD-metalloendopeptidase family protein n=1 Tax=Psychroflexus sp. MES1-P1E TaxID=2058320 RepID=UPI000C79DCD7|nr:peptidoglycan DD-metalloendopeptidase family protein [Psychroflexus sp. MES1-P1E]PKG41189.1 hypothetical protein CXF67_16505 [Psychroflexus sp. MES1-P1E]
MFCVEGYCPEGYTRDSSGECVEVPCAGDPIRNPRIAEQKVSGLEGGRYGCTRIGGVCENSQQGKDHGGTDILNPYGAPVYAMFDGNGVRNKQHNGIDLKNPYGAPIFAMFDGLVYNTPYHYKSGYMVQLQSTLPNGEPIITTYFHLQENNRIEASTNPLNHVTAGQIIGYQGKSGNLAGAISGGYTDSHVHVETRLHDGGSSWNFDNNFNLIDPRIYFETEIDDNGNVTDDCD